MVLTVLFTGTNGGVTPVGLLASFLGGLAVGVAYYISQILLVRDLHLADPQWPIIIYGAMAGLMGSMLDSVLGAHWQYSGGSVNDELLMCYYQGLVMLLSGIRYVIIRD